MIIVNTWTGLSTEKDQELRAKEKDGKANTYLVLELDEGIKAIGVDSYTRKQLFDLEGKDTCWQKSQNSQRRDSTTRKTNGHTI